VQAAIDEADAAEGQAELVQEARRRLMIVKHSQRLDACSQVEVDQVDIPDLAFKLQDAGVTNLLREEGAQSGLKERVAQLQAQIESIEETQEAQGTRDEFLAGKMKKGLPKKEIEAKGDEPNWSTVERPAQARELEEKGVKGVQEEDLKRLREALTEAEAAAAVEQQEVASMQDKVGVEHWIIDAAQAKLSQAQAYSALLHAMQPRPPMLDLGLLDEAISECRRVEVPLALVQKGYVRQREVEAYAARRRRVLESLRIKGETTPEPDPTAVSKLVYGLVKAIKEAEDMEVGEFYIAPAEERLVTLAVYAERLMEMSGNRDACIVC